MINNRLLPKIGPFAPFFFVAAFSFFFAVGDILDFGLFLPSLSASDPSSASSPDEWQKDGFPFIYGQEKDAVSEIWAKLEKNDPSSGKEKTPTETGFILLRRQSHSLRGQPVTIRGRLLRTTIRVGELASGDAPPGESSNDYYESWVLLDDERSIPARLLTRSIPTGFVPDSPQDGQNEEKAENSPPKRPNGRLYRRETITATGIYYRQTSYNAGADFYNAPTIVALDFRVLADPDAAEAQKATAANTQRKDNANFSRFYWRFGILFLLVLGWIILRSKLFRRRLKTAFPPPAESIADPNFSFRPEDLSLLKETADQSKKERELRDEKRENEKRDYLSPLGVFFLAAVLATDSGPALRSRPEPTGDSSPTKETIDRVFWENVTELSSGDLFPATSEKDPAFQRGLTIIYDRLSRSVSEPVLRLASPLGLSPDVEMTATFLNRFPENFGCPVPFRGKVRRIAAEKTGGKETASPSDLTLFRLELETSDGQPLIVYAGKIPKAWGEKGERGIGEETGGIGIFFHRLPSSSSPSEEAAKKTDAIPILLAHRVGRFSDSDPLGRLGVDLSLFDDLPARPISALSATKDPTKKKEILDNFRLTGKDRVPFYSILAAVGGAPATAVLDIARNESKNEKITVPDLFNRPEQFQGRAVAVTGNLKRVRKIPVNDPEIRALFGIDHYYELYLFTNESQGYPLVFCLTKIPPELDEGTGDNYRRRASVAGFFYKPWAYGIEESENESSPDNSQKAGSRSADDSSEVKNRPWIAVPLLLGGDSNVFPDETTRKSSGPGTTVLLALFFGLGIVTLLYLTFRPKRPPIEFRLSGQSGPREESSFRPPEISELRTVKGSEKKEEEEENSPSDDHSEPSK